MGIVQGERITNAYRTPAYNSAIGGAPGSLHSRFNALDFGASGVSPTRVGAALRWMREREGLFIGGISGYQTFVHLDTRATNATWAGAGATEDGENRAENGGNCSNGAAPGGNLADVPRSPQIAIFRPTSLQAGLDRPQGLDSGLA